MTQEATQIKARLGPNPVELKISLNPQTGYLIVEGPVQLPGLMLEMLARGVSQVGKMVELKKEMLTPPEMNGAPAEGEAKKVDLILPSRRIFRPGE